MSKSMVDTLTAEFENTIGNFTNLAKKDFETLKRNLTSESAMLDNHSQAEVETALEIIEGYKDESILDELVTHVLSKFTDGDLEDLEDYDEACALLSEYQETLEESIDRVIEDIEPYRTYYVAYRVEDNEIMSFSTSESEVIEDLNSKKDTDYQYKLSSFQILSFEFSVADDGDDRHDPNYLTKVLVKIDNKVEEFEFYIQLLSDYFMSHMGCEVSSVTLNDAESEPVMPKCIDIIIEETEKHARKATRKSTALHGTGFNCSINGSDVCIRELKDDGYFELVKVNLDFNTADYNTLIEGVYGIFDTLEEAQDFVDTYKTGEYSDFNGLHELMQVFQEC